MEMMDMYQKLGIDREVLAFGNKIEKSGLRRLMKQQNTTS